MRPGLLQKSAQGFGNSSHAPASRGAALPAPSAGEEGFSLDLPGLPAAVLSSRRGSQGSSLGGE